MAQYLALPLNKCCINAMYKDDSNPAYKHEYDSKGHFGLDMTGGSTTFYASGNGTVVGVGGSASAGLGYWVAIKYDSVYQWNMTNDNKATLSSIIVRYCHLASKSTLTVNQSVTLDSKIGTYGNTGSLKGMSVHLHVEVDTSTLKPNYTPTLGTSGGDLYAATTDTTIDPCFVFFRKTSSPESQTLTYSQSYCDIHPSAKEAYINTGKVERMGTRSFT